MFTLKPLLLALWWAVAQRSLGRLDHDLQPPTEETWISSSPHSSVMLANGYQALKTNHSFMPPAASQLEVMAGWRRAGQRGWIPQLEHHHHLQTDLHGNHLKVAAVDNWPWFGLGVSDDGSAVADSGIDVSILNTLGHVLNFTYSVVVQEDGQWGGPQDNGTVTGMLGMVARQEVHLAIDEITITAARARVVDFTRPYFMESSACVSQAPREENQAFAVLTPFTTQVWLIIGLNVIGIGLVLFLVSFLIGQYLEVGVTFSVHDVTFNTYRSLVIQGNRLPTEEWPLRCVLLAWYFFCYYIYGRLTAVLAIPVFEKPIDTLLDVLQAAAQHGLYPVVIRESSVHYMFQMATSGIYHDVGRLITDDKNYVDAPPSGVASVLEGKAAYIDARLSSEIQTIIQGRDNFFIGRQSFFPQSYGIACSKGTSHRAIFDRVLERIVEAGLVDKWKKDEIIKLGQAASLAGRLDQARRGVGPGAITIKHLQGAFFMYVLGSGVACLVFLVEKMYRSSSSILP